MMNPSPEQLLKEFEEAEQRTSEHLRTPAELKEHRLSICTGCEAKGEMFGLSTCTECNCLLGFKIPLVSSTCPRGKW